MKTLVIYHPQRLIREIWGAFLNTRAFVNVVGDADNFEQLINMVAILRPQVCLARVDLGHLTDVSGLAALRKASANTRIVLVCPNYPTVLMMLLNRIGIEGYLTKHSSLNEMHSAILHVATGLPYRSASLVQQTPDPHTLDFANQFALLTKKELEILTLSLHGSTAKEIASHFGLSLKTVEVHRYHILQKLSCSKTLQVFKKLELFGIGE